MSKKIALSVDYFFIVVDYTGTFSKGEMPVNVLTTLELGYDSNRKKAKGKRNPGRRHHFSRGQSLLWASKRPTYSKNSEQGRSLVAKISKYVYDYLKSNE